MEPRKESLNERTKEYFSKTKENIIQSQKNLLSTIASFSDEEGRIVLTMDNTQIIHSLSISEKLLVASDKREIMGQLTWFINEAMLKAGKNAAQEVQKAMPAEEFKKIVSGENKEVKKQIELLIQKNNQSIQEMASTKKTIVSASGNVTVIVFGNRMIHSIDISDKYFSVENKSEIEREIMETINKAIREIMEVIQEQMKKNEDEFNKKINQE